MCLTIPYLGSLLSYLHVLPQSIHNLSTTYMEYLPWHMLSTFNHKICIKCHNHNTSLYWKCEGLASPMPMQPTHKHLRISYVHKVNNNMTQLLSMLHLFKYYQMHCSISNNNTDCKMTYGCSNPFLSHGSPQVEYSSWWLALVSLTLHTYPLSQCVCTKLPHHMLVWMV